MTKKKFYDIEVFPNYFLIVSKVEGSDDYTVLETPTLMEIINFLAEDYMLVGANNHRYDDVVLSTLITQMQVARKPFDTPIDPMDAYNISQTIMNEEVDVYLRGLEQPTEDLFKYRDAETLTLSLKSFESVLGMDIEECAYDFNEPLPYEAREHVVNYCKHDVDATEAAYNYLEKRGSVEAVISLRDYVANELNVEPTTLTKLSTSSLLIRLLGKNTYKRSNMFDYIDACSFDYAFSDQQFTQWYEEVIKFTDDALKLNKPIAKIVRDETTYDLSLGGIHGRSSQTIFHDCVHIDFSSLYPSILIKINGLGSEPTKTYAEIVKKRLKSKKTNPTLASGLKLIVNKLYGLARSDTSGAQLYNKYIGLDICIVGQTMLYDLSLRLEEAGATLINVNTDGIVYKTNGNDEAINEVTEEFEHRVGIQLDEDIMPHFYSKDVNNYFVLDDNGNAIKVKGDFAIKPYYNNLATYKYVIEQKAAELVGRQPLTMRELFEQHPEWFILRAKVNRTITFWLGNITTKPRYSEKTGRRLKHDEEIFESMIPVGRQIRMYAVTSDLGWDIRHFNKKTNKFAHNGQLKTGTYPTRFDYEATQESINIDYYLDQATKLLKLIGEEPIDLFA